MTKSSAQDVHANAPDGAIDAFLKKFDISDSFGDFTAAADSNGTMFFGSGNSDHNYHLQENKTLGFELGLKEHFRTGDDILHTNLDATGHDVANFTAPEGTQIPDPAHDVGSTNANRAAWSFDYAVVTGLDGKTPVSPTLRSKWKLRRTEPIRIPLCWTPAPTSGSIRRTPPSASAEMISPIPHRPTSPRIV